MNINNPAEMTQASAFAGVIERARQQKLSVSELFQVAETLAGAGRHSQVADLYNAWIAYNANSPLLHLVYFNYSVAIRQLGDLPGAINALRAAVSAEPKFGAAHINLGRALEDSGLIDAALAQWRSFVDDTSDITPERLSHRLMSLQHIGRVLEGAGRLDEAESALWQAIELQPDKHEAAQHWTASRQRQCKWPLIVPSAYVTERQLLDSMSPMTLSCYTDNPLFLLAKAHRYGKSLVGRPDLNGFTPKRPRKISGSGQPLRVGYLSSDLREHAVGFALCEVLQLHDKTNVEVFAYYCGPTRSRDTTQERIRNAVHCWRDIAALTDAEAARLIADDDIDILIDVNGYTKLARATIFAYRPAPVIVNFCGFPGSTGSPFHQYMIADNYIVPPENEIYYSEKVLRIACNQPVDRKREISERPTRAAAGLPEDAFVYACFNGMQKITAACFTRWMTILTATPGSVLWLLSGDEGAQNRLHDLARKSGIAPERLIFAPKAPNAHHLARISLADLFLDTFPYGAHSTAADAITMGLPVLTVSGKSFASRFCGSIVAAAGIPQMICATADEYVGRAIAFASDRTSLELVKEALRRQRDTCALRDMPALARRLEELFWQMQGEAEQGKTPVPDLRNLETYYDVGAELVLRGHEFEDEDSYREKFREKLTQLHQFSPIPEDNRLARAL